MERRQKNNQRICTAERRTKEHPPSSGFFPGEQCGRPQEKIVDEKIHKQQYIYIDNLLHRISPSLLIPPIIAPKRFGFCQTRACDPDRAHIISQAMADIKDPHPAAGWGSIPIAVLFDF